MGKITPTNQIKEINSHSHVVFVSILPVLLAISWLSFMRRPKTSGYLQIPSRIPRRFLLCFSPCHKNTSAVRLS
jgi:hypothetical protein